MQRAKYLWRRYYGASDITLPASSTPPPEYDDLIDDIMSKFASDDSAMPLNNTDDDTFSPPNEGSTRNHGRHRVQASADIEVIELSDDGDGDDGVEVEPPKTTSAKSDQCGSILYINSIEFN